MQGLESTDRLIGNGVGSVALNVELAFWQSGCATRSLYAFFSGVTISLLGATALGAFGLFDRL
jgi:hypothetical protein